jgi:hypothetical protein
VSGGSKRDRSSGLQWLNDGKHGGAVAVKGVEEEEGSLHGGCSFYSRRRRLAKAARAAAGAVAVVKLGRGKAAATAVSTGGAIVQTARLTSGPSGFRFFQFIQNQLDFKNQNGWLKVIFNSAMQM